MLPAVQTVPAAAGCTWQPPSTHFDTMQVVFTPGRTFGVQSASTAQSKTRQCPPPSQVPAVPFSVQAVPLVVNATRHDSSVHTELTQVLMPA
jgi:hypothetical protein